eukprot:gene9727-11357_t
MPWNTLPDQIREFFAPLVLENINILYNSNGKQTGEAYIEFQSDDDLTRSLRRHKGPMGHRYIEVIQKPRFVMVQALARGGDKGRDGGSVNNDRDRTASRNTLRLRGLPFIATTQEIRSFFNGYPIKDNNILIEMGDDGRPTGEAFVEFQTHELAQGALKNLQKKTLNSRSGGSGSGGGRDSGRDRDHNKDHTKTLVVETVKLRGLPFTASEGEIASFFEGLDILPDGIKIIYQKDRPSGMAYVSFTNQKDFQAAQLRHNNHLGSRYIEYVVYIGGENTSPSMWIFTIANSQWKQGPVLTPHRRYPCNAIDTGTSIYVFGGEGLNTKQLTVSRLPFVNLSKLATKWEPPLFDTQTNTLSAFNDIKYSVCTTYTFIVGTLIFIVGGYLKGEKIVTLDINTLRLETFMEHGMFPKSVNPNVTNPDIVIRCYDQQEYLYMINDQSHFIRLSIRSKEIKQLFPLPVATIDYAHQHL